jgi:hypothetical protein
LFTWSASWLAVNTKAVKKAITVELNGKAGIVCMF